MKATSLAVSKFSSAPKYSTSDAISSAAVATAARCCDGKTLSAAGPSDALAKGTVGCVVSRFLSIVTHDGLVAAATDAATAVSVSAAAAGCKPAFACNPGLAHLGVSCGVVPAASIAGVAADAAAARVPCLPVVASGLKETLPGVCCATARL